MAKPDDKEKGNWIYAAIIVAILLYLFFRKKPKRQPSPTPPSGQGPAATADNPRVIDPTNDEHDCQ